MFQIPYLPTERFTYNGTVYRIKSVTKNALEIGCNATQSLWVSKAELERLLATNGKGGYFRWHIIKRMFVND